MTDNPDTNDLSQALMQLRILLEPMHEFLIGEVTYFETQGFTSEQARAMAAAEYCRLTQGTQAT